MMRMFQLWVVFTLATLGAHANSIDPDTCTHGSCESATSASLLQKVFQRDEKSTVMQEQVPQSEDNLYGTVCTGTQAQGRCWFLSEMGESCAATCAIHGRRFSFVISDPDAPMTPQLVGHEPKVKQQAWAALECYVPSEDRFHTANENAARHYVNDIGNWTHENCKLACPCGGAESDRCSWRAPASCAAEFMFKGVKYSGCATVDLEHERPWCNHNFQHTDKDSGTLVQDWSYCSYDCIPEEPVPPKKDTCEWIPAYSCVKEYDYEGTHFVGCTGTDHDTPWCSNADPYKGSWNHCTYSCANREEKKDPWYPVPVPVPSTEQLCTWQPNPGCAKAFEYKGVEYTGCIEQDHPTPWCSLERVHAGTWETCTRVCSRASGAVLPVPQPPAPPVPQPAYPVPRTPTDISEPCDRHPDTENDVIGNSVTLDETGYKITAAAESPVNMKRFICRVVNSIGCRAMDFSALMGFVPYYSGLAAHQTFKRLESELTTLCHAGGKWVVPRPLP